MWTQFRRLLLGTVVEIFRNHGISTDVAGLVLEFHDDSEFKVPRLDNSMRFRGHVHAPVTVSPSADKVRALERELRGVWPELLQVVKIPIGDRLDQERNEVRVHATATEIRVVFDLIAD